ncbi:hypothetical protein GCM10023340_07600 [Nocardioides marinquilinus]|uniref:non-specific serine/threonine protein kinase n=1 Tax=Nocardioides marinquilinus TaxID=1210400 RepID=A0ABP9P9M7_9ACTN
MTAGPGGPGGPVGTVGPYRLEEVLGSGAMGAVHAATDLRLGRRVALKLISGAAASAPGFRLRFEREAAVLARLDSPHVVRILDHGEVDGRLYIAMQLAAGGDLGRLLRERGAMPPPLAARVAAQLADALVAAHDVGVVHRDVKPSNVLLRDDRLDRVHVYLSDFGVALTESSGLTTPGAVAGTWNYLAPERTRGEPGSAASDVYAVGCVLHELLTGRPPYAGSDVEVAMLHLSAPVPQLPGEDGLTLQVNRILAQSMAKDPAERYADARALRHDLRQLVGTLTGATPLPDLPPLGATGRSRRRRGIALAAAAGLLVAGGVVAGVAVAGGDDDPGADPPGPTDATSSSTVPGPDGTDGTDATGSTGTTGEPTPSGPPPIVPGDLDGDGLGDLAYSDYDRGLVTLRSQGDGFAPAQAREVDGTAALTGDFDGDGRTDVLTLLDDTSTVALTLDPARGRGSSSAVSLPRVGDDLDRDFLAADLDGDGADELVVASPTRSRGTAVDVVAVGESGGFGDPERWYEGDLTAVESVWAVGDFDRDGRDDLVHAVLEQVYGEQPSQFQMLLSTGRALEPAGDPVRVSEQYGGEYLSLDEVHAGDVDADGAPELVLMNSFGFDAVVWRWVAGRDGFSSAQIWALGLERGGDGLEGTLSDVDGDGDADVVTLGIDGVRVLLSTGTSFRYAPQWRDRDEPGDLEGVVDDVAPGIY